MAHWTIGMMAIVRRTIAFILALFALFLFACAMGWRPHFGLAAIIKGILQVVGM